MLKLIVEAWPEGKERNKRVIGRAEIRRERVSPGNGLANYRGAFASDGRTLHSVLVDAPRSTPFWNLIYYMLHLALREEEPVVEISEEDRDAYRHLGQSILNTEQDYATSICNDAISETNHAVHETREDDLQAGEETRPLEVGGEGEEVSADAAGDRARMETDPTA